MKATHRIWDLKVSHLGEDKRELVGTYEGGEPGDGGVAETQLPRGPLHPDVPRDCEDLTDGIELPNSYRGLTDC